jgi:hypothetical protein
LRRNALANGYSYIAAVRLLRDIEDKFVHELSVGYRLQIAKIRCKAPFRN